MVTNVPGPDTSISINNNEICDLNFHTCLPIGLYIGIFNYYIKF